MLEYFGEIIKKLRIKKKYTQEELAEGICSRKQLMRIEKGESISSTYVLKELSYRLDENLLDYLPYADIDKPMYWKHKIDELEEQYIREDFNQLYIKSKTLIEQKALLKSAFLRQRIHWYYATSTQYIDTVKSAGINYYINLLKLSIHFTDIYEIWRNNLKPFEIRIINAMAILYFNKGDSKTAEEIMLKTINNFDMYNSIIHDFAYVKIIYNLGAIYFKQKKYKKSLNLAEKGIKLCQNNGILNGIIILIRIKAISLYELDKKDEALVYFNLFIHSNHVLYKDSIYDYKNINQKLIDDYKIAPLSYLK